MTPLEFENKMKELVGLQNIEITYRGELFVDVSDPETTHKKADNLLAEVLNSLGYQKGIKIFESMPKWYA